MVKRIRRAVVTLLGLVFAMASEAKGDEFYYAMIFGSQSRPKLLEHPHLGDVHPGRRGGSRGEQLLLLPAHHQLAAGVVRRPDLELAPRARCNLDLYRTLEAVYRDRERVTMWGPFRIHQVGYERSLQAKQILDSGVAGYRAISTPRNFLNSDCIHAVAAVDPVFGRGHYPLVRIGRPAGTSPAR